MSCIRCGADSCRCWDGAPSIETVSADVLNERIAEVERRIELTIESFGSAPAALLEKLSILRELRQMRGERSEMERDAARYRYVRNRITGASVADGRHTMTIEFPVGIRLWMNPDGFDTTVDAALSDEKREGHT